MRSVQLFALASSATAALASPASLPTFTLDGANGTVSVNRDTLLSRFPESAALVLATTQPPNYLVRGSGEADQKADAQSYHFSNASSGILGSLNITDAALMSENAHLELAAAANNGCDCKCKCLAGCVAGILLGPGLYLICAAACNACTH